MSCNNTFDSFPASLDFSVLTGTTFQQYFTWYTQVTGSPPTPVDLTSFSGDMKVKDAQGIVLVELTTGNGGIVLGGTAGTIQLYLSSTATALYAQGTYEYDLFLSSNGSPNIVTAFLSGSFIVIQSVTG